MNTNNITKREVALAIYERTAATIPQKDIVNVIQMTLDYVQEAMMSGRNVEFRGFGTFQLQERKARIGRNPKKPEDTVTIPNRLVVKFSPGKVMKHQLTALHQKHSRSVAAK